LIERIGAAFVPYKPPGSDGQAGDMVSAPQNGRKIERENRRGIEGLCVALDVGIIIALGEVRPSALLEIARMRDAIRRVGNDGVNCRLKAMREKYFQAVPEV
jgi:hypothetical protein